jgi:Asp-tRNA(Asn)/Glu-tRNA(Gln) amidotransferase C subunit
MGEPVAHSFPARSFPAPDVAALTARLEIPEDRAETVLGTLRSIYEVIDVLDTLPLGETPPATAFDARWE